MEPEDQAKREHLSQQFLPILLILAIAYMYYETLHLHYFIKSGLTFPEFEGYSKQEKKEKKDDIEDVPEKVTIEKEKEEKKDDIVDIPENVTVEKEKVAIKN